MNASEPPEIEQRPQSRRQWSGWLRSLVLPLGLVVAIVGGLLYLESDGSSSDGAESRFCSVPLPPERNPTGRAPAGAVDRAAPDFLLESLGGEAELRLSDLQGRPLLVNFWATWCTTCRAETPDLVEAFERHRADGLLVVGVNQREADAGVQRFVDEFGVGYPITMDRRGEVARTWRIGGPSQGLPSSYFIDSRGVIRKVVFGLMRARDLEEGLALILEAD